MIAVEKDLVVCEKHYDSHFMEFVACPFCRAENAEERLREIEDLLEEAIGHLDYCGYGDTWERQVAQTLKEKLTNWERVTDKKGDI